MAMSYEEMKKAEAAREAEKRRREAHEKRYDDYLGGVVASAAERLDELRAQAAEDERKQKIAEHESHLRSQMLSAYIAANGSDQGFDDVYKELRAEHVKRMTLERMAQKPITAGDIVSEQLAALYEAN